MMAGTDARPLVIVGVDGSAQAKAALAWAAGYAEVTGATVRAVIAWEFPLGFGYLPPAQDLDVDFVADATAALQEAVTEVGKEHPDVAIETRVVHGFPARVLPRMAADADLLVVGSHGRGAFAEALLGSVSHGCVHHAPCPVVVVRNGHVGAHDTAA
jgi:nucleotide-binding universal stress UspA family protein